MATYRWLEKGSEKQNLGWDLAKNRTTRVQVDAVVAKWRVLWGLQEPQYYLRFWGLIPYESEFFII